MPVKADEVKKRIEDYNQTRLKQAINVIDLALNNTKEILTKVALAEEDVVGLVHQIKQIYTDVGWTVNYGWLDNTCVFEFLINGEYI